MTYKELKEVWILDYTKKNNHGEKEKVWQFKKLNTKTGTAFLNCQQDLNELDITSAGTVDYTIENARTTYNYEINKGNGICFHDISKEEKLKPDYIVSDKITVGKTTLYKLKKYNGE